MNYLTTTEAAAQLGITRRGVLKAIERDQLPAEKWGRDWLIESEQIERRRLIMDAQRAWKQLGITRRIWGQAAFSGGTKLVECGNCDDVAFQPGRGTKYSSWKACPSCGWAEKGERVCG